MAVWSALNNGTPVAREVRDLGAGAGEIDCLECDGNGQMTPWRS
jgi:hypothetical protein